MSPMSTPNRPTRGVAVPSIDTRCLDEKPQVCMLFSGWPMTPQSANESRRPSLAYSSFSDACHSRPSSIGGFSQPVTPVSSMQHQVDFTPQWTAGSNMQASLPNGLPDNCSDQAPHPMISSAYPQHIHAISGATDTHFALPAGHTQALNVFGRHSGHPSPIQNGWKQPQPATSLESHEGLRTTLFHPSHGIGQETSASYSHSSMSIPTHLEASAFPNYDTPSSIVSLHQPLQVVVPSQVGPHEDFPVEAYPPYSGHHVHEGLSNSFDSAATGYSGWDFVEPPSPMKSYFGRSEDEGYMHIKHEEQLTPTRSARSGTSRRFVTSSYGQPHPRRRSVKRGRKPRMEGSAWAELEVAGTTVRCEGARFGVDGLDESGRLNVVPAETQQRKLHKCNVELANGKLCKASFLRSEHLKRHMVSHTKERKYPCPLPRCNKAIARPDNATDHFKTHLRRPVKGKRNDHHTWAELEPLLLHNFDEKTAQKLVTNLRKWLCKENVKNESGQEIPGYPLIQWHRMEEMGMN